MRDARYVSCVHVGMMMMGWKEVCNRKHGYANASKENAEEKMQGVKQQQRSMGWLYRGPVQARGEKSVM